MIACTGAVARSSKSFGGESIVETSNFRKIEIDVANCREDRENGIVWRRICAIRESSAVEINACGALAELSDAGGDSGSAGESGEINAVIVDGEDCVRVVGDGLGGFDFGSPGAIAGIIGGGDDVAVFLGSGLELNHRDAAPPARIEQALVPVKQFP